jgi:hypothetical protein
LPIVLTRAGLEQPILAQGVEAIRQAFDLVVSKLA